MTLISYNIIISNKFEDPQWDEFLENTPNGHHLQTSLWAQIKSTIGWKSLRVIARKQEKIVGGAQILIRPLPVTGYMGYIARGPVFKSDDPNLVNLFFNELKQIVKKNSIKFLAIQPEIYNKSLDKILQKCAIKSNLFSVSPSATVLINLTQSTDEILMRMRKKTRQNIRRSLKEDITVREGTERDLDTFYDLYILGSQRNNFKPFGKEYINDLWRILNSRKLVKLFICEFKNNPIISLLIIPFRDTVYTKLIGWSGEFSKLLPNEAIKWGIINWAKSHGYQYLDFEGIDLNGALALTKGAPLPDSLRNTPTYFKIGFGGEIHICPQTYIYIYNPFLRLMFKIFIANRFSKNILNKMKNIIRMRST